MQLSKFITVLSLGGIITLSAGCANVISSGVESGMVFVVAKHDETVAKKERRYTAIDRCIFNDSIEAYALAEVILANNPLKHKYDVILSRTGGEIDPVGNNQLAYAFYLIADEINDKRAKVRIKMLQKYIPEPEAAEIRSIIHDKYLSSYLEKCFIVPGEYKASKTSYQIIKEDESAN